MAIIRASSECEWNRSELRRRHGIVQGSDDDDDDDEFGYFEPAGMGRRHHGDGVSRQHEHEHEPPGFVDRKRRRATLS